MLSRGRHLRPGRLLQRPDDAMRFVGLLRPLDFRLLRGVGDELSQGVRLRPRGLLSIRSEALRAQ